MQILRNILPEKCIPFFWLLMRKKGPYLYFWHIYIRTRVSVLCYRGSVCPRWMTEIMWFLSILILTGAPFQKGQEWQSEKFSRGCLRTCFENMKQFNPLDCPWLLRKGCAWRAQDVVRNTDEQDHKAGVCRPSLCTFGTAGTMQEGAEDHFTGSHMHFIVFFLSFRCRIFLCVLELFVNYHLFVEWSGDFLGGAVV